MATDGVIVRFYCPRCMIFAQSVRTSVHGQWICGICGGNTEPEVTVMKNRTRTEPRTGATVTFIAEDEAREVARF